MTSLRLALSGIVFDALTSPVFAQQQSTTPAGPRYGYGYHMWYGPGWDHGWGWHPWFFLGPLLMIVVLIGIVLLVVWLTRTAMYGAHGWHHGIHHGFGACPTCGRRGSGLALDILAERFARGEIDKTEFEEKRKTLGS